MEKIYRTERLHLKVLDETHADLVADYFSRNRTFLERWECQREEVFFTDGYQREQLEREVQEIEAGRMLKLWLFKKSDEKRIIGTLAFSNILRGPFLSCFLGYRLDREELCQGYMTEALEKGIEIIFGAYGLHRIEANIMPDNLPSLRVVENLGFKREGLAEKYLKINGVWEDHIHMVLLNDRL